MLDPKQAFLLCSVLTVGGVGSIFVGIIRRLLRTERENIKRFKKEGLIS